MPPAFSEGVRFEMGVAEAREQLHQLREEKVDLVVLLSHLGFPQDLKLAAETPGVDVILSGHTHNRLHEPARVGDTLIIQSGCHGAYIGRLDLEIADGRVSLRRHRLIAVDAGPQDDQVAGLVETALAPERERLARVIGRTAIPLHRYAMASAPMDDVLLAAAAQAAGVDIAFSNGWRYGAPVAPGPVTLGDLYNMAPMNPPISRTTLTGAELKAMLEENLERTFAADPYAQMGGYIKRCRGLTAFVKLENPKGQRLDRLLVGTALSSRRRTIRWPSSPPRGCPNVTGETAGRSTSTLWARLNPGSPTIRPARPICLRASSSYEGTPYGLRRRPRLLEQPL